jgi:HAD superfamily hydrolase (TIGR01509 family)
MAALVERLHVAGVRLYLLSNAPNLLDAWLRGPAHQRHPFLGLFSDYVVSGLVGHSKPDAAIYRLACRSGGFAPDAAVFVDDVLANVEGARAIGMLGVHHRSPAGTIHALQRLGLPA